MGLDTLKHINIADLPVTGDISGDDYLIIQGSEITARVQFKDIYITKENTTFGQEINDLYEKIDKLTTIVDEIPNVEDVYTKDQVDTKLSAKPNISEILTKPQVEESYHSKTIVDAKIQSRAAKIDVYIKSEVDQKIAGVISTVNSLESEIQSIEKRLQALEGLHDRNKENHHVPTISWNDLTDKPTTSSNSSSSSGTTIVGFSGNYNDLKNKPNAVSATTSGLMTPAQKAKLDSLDPASGKIPVSIRNFGGGKNATGSSSDGYILDSIRFSGNGQNPRAEFRLLKSNAEYTFDFAGSSGSNFYQTR